VAPPIDWDLDLETQRDLARDDPGLEGLAAAVRTAVGERATRVRVVDADGGRVLVYAEPGAFLTLAAERPWAVLDDVGRIHSSVRGWDFVARAEGASGWFRVTGTRANGAAPDEIVVERDAAPRPWEAERLLLYAEDPAYAASLGASWFEPRYERIELVELAVAPTAPGVDRANVVDGLRRGLRAPWKLGAPRRLGVFAFAERYAAERGLELLPDAPKPAGTWFLEQAIFKANTVMRGRLDADTFGLLFYGEHALHTSRGNLREDWTLAVVDVPATVQPIDDFVCRARLNLMFGHHQPHEQIPDGLTEIPSGDARVDALFVLAVASPERADRIQSLFGEPFASWLAALPRDKTGDRSLRFELRDHRICVCRKGLLDDSAALDAHCRATARIARTFG
jgi:hypothetical protein